MRLGSDSLEQYCEEKIEDKEISARLQSSEICRGLLLHGNGYEENRQSPSGEKNIISLFGIAPPPCASIPSGVHLWALPYLGFGLPTSSHK